MKNIYIIIVILFGSLTAMAQTKKTDTVDENAMKWYLEYERKVSDTAHYWVKDVSSRGSGVYSTILLPVRDTLLCYFEYVSGDQAIPGRSIETTWMLGYVTRFKEQVTGFMYDKKSKAPVKVLYYQIQK